MSSEMQQAGDIFLIHFCKKKEWEFLGVSTFILVVGLFMITKWNLSPHSLSKAGSSLIFPNLQSKFPFIPLLSIILVERDREIEILNNLLGLEIRILDYWLWLGEDGRSRNKRKRWFHGLKINGKDYISIFNLGTSVQQLLIGKVSLMPNLCMDKITKSYKR